MEGDAALPAPSPGATGTQRSSERPLFAHASEAELARILDFYDVRWEYEPHVFPILWNLDGSVAESFSPDFYLPDFDTYLELTTLRQPLVRKKNRKLRRLRELYPDIGIKLFYARDFRALMLKYGKLGLVDALSGTPGQVSPATSPTGDGPDGTGAPDQLPRDLLGGHPADAPATGTTDELVPAPPPAVPGLRRSRRRRRRAIVTQPSVVTGPEA